jgi:hypothetical protein
MARLRAHDARDGPVLPGDLILPSPLHDGKSSAKVRVQVLYKRPEIPANGLVPAIAVSVTYTKHERAENPGSIRYLDYLNNRPPGERVMKTMHLCDQKTAP